MVQSPEDWGIIMCYLMFWLNKWDKYSFARRVKCLYKENILILTEKKTAYPRT